MWDEVGWTVEVWGPEKVQVAYRRVRTSPWGMNRSVEQGCVFLPFWMQSWEEVLWQISLFLTEKDGEWRVVQRLCHSSNLCHLYTRLTNRSLKPTQYWSQNWPSEKVMASLCQEKHLYVIPHCFDDELINFISAADIEENNYVEILPSTSSSSSSSN